MMDYEPITKELRKDFDLCTRIDGIAPDEFETVWITKSAVLATLDNIDAIHRSLEHENERLQEKLNNAYNSVGDYDSGYNAGYVAGKGSSDFASIDNWLSEHEGAMAEHGWVRGPIGADGKPMSEEHMVVDNSGNVGVIVETRFNDSDWVVLVDFGEGKSVRFVWFLPRSLTHYHAPTVEDVLREFAADFVGCANCVDDHEVTDAIELFAPKLRLAGDAE